MMTLITLSVTHQNYSFLCFSFLLAELTELLVKSLIPVEGLKVDSAVGYFFLCVALLRWAGL